MMWRTKVKHWSELNCNSTVTELKLTSAQPESEHSTLIETEMKIANINWTANIYHMHTLHYNKHLKHLQNNLLTVEISKRVTFE